MIVLFLVFNVTAEWLEWRGAPPEQRLWAKLVRFVEAGRLGDVGRIEDLEWTESSMHERPERIHLGDGVSERTNK